MTTIAAVQGGSQAQTEPAAWHAEAAEAVAAGLASGPGGLSETEAALRLERFGPNRLPAAKPKSALARFLAQFHNVLIYVLLAAAVVTALLQHWADAGVILAVVLANAVIGFVQEGRAQQALAALQDMIAPRAIVIRSGARQAVDAAALVPGDVVILEAGDRAPADLRLMETRNLTIDEALLTGESIAAAKDPTPVAAAAELGERSSMAFSGTMARTGAGRGVVVATGQATEIGRIGRLLGEVQALETPLVRQMERFGRQLTLVVLAVSALVLVFAVGLRDYSWADGFLVVVGLAVASMPEGLPAVITITLAIGVRRMAARHAVIRRLPAVETLGAVSVVCSDKTGTLTKNEMTVQTLIAAEGRFEVTGAGYAPEGELRRDGAAVEPQALPGLAALLEAGALCGDAELVQRDGAWAVLGDPMDGALLTLARKGGLDPDALREARPRLDAIPFDAAHRFMATLHAGSGGPVVYLKGAPEQILSMCSEAQGAAGPEPLDREARLAEVDALAADGQRVLAFARRPWRAGEALSLERVGQGCTFLGFAGFIDPPREEAGEAIAACRSAGIAVKMITGDHPITAAAIARQLGLAENPQVVVGREIEATSDADLPALARRATVVARASPEHKLRLVQALQAQGAIVAMTGDGVNDAPALKRADIGVAMGVKGAETAREASAMVLTDDNFASIVAAVREGRTVNDNLRKVIGWTLPTNGGEAMTIISAILLGLTLPLTPIQILWVNMVTEVALGLTLAFEPPEGDVMRRPPRRPDAPLLSPFLVWRIVLVSVLVALGVFGMFAWAQARGLSLEASRTIAVNTLVVAQIFYLFSVRYLHGPSITGRGMLGTPAVLFGVSVTILAQLLFTYAPFLQAVFETRPIGLLDAAAIVGVGVALLAVLELDKAMFNRRARRSP